MKLKSSIRLSGQRDNKIMVLELEVAKGTRDGNDTAGICVKQQNINQNQPPSPRQDLCGLAGNLHGLSWVLLLLGPQQAQRESPMVLGKTEEVTLHYAKVSSQCSGQAGSATCEKTVKFWTECEFRTCHLMAKLCHLPAGGSDR